MKKLFLTLFLLALFTCAFFPAELCLASQVESGWKINNAMKFNFGYLPPTGVIKAQSAIYAGKNYENIERPIDLGFTRSYVPDITNINLEGFVGMGFPVKVKGEAKKYNFFIKLFMFPKFFNPEASSLPLIKGYFLDCLANGPKLIEYASQYRNLAVKLCYVDKSETVFSLENPYPALIIDTKDKNAQEYFNQNTIFSSLYIQPDKSCYEKIGDEELAKSSSRGVLAFHNEILKIYNEKLISLKSENDDKHYFYGIKNENNGRQILTIIKIAKQPLLFDNWRNLPMPQDPTKIFLTGLLLLHKYDYVLKDEKALAGNEIPPVDSPEFNKIFKKINTHVLEIASVVNLKK